MATTARVPLDVYLRSEYEPDAEYVDGVIEERPMGELDHGEWLAAILVWFRQHGKAWNIRAIPALRVQVAPARYRVPDVTVFDRAHPKEQILTHPPLAVFEMLSPEDTHRKLTRKLKDYAGMGIPEIWIVDPEDGIFLRFEEDQLVRRERFCIAANGMDFLLSEIAGRVE